MLEDNMVTGNRWLAGEFDYRDGIFNNSEELSLADVYNNEHASKYGIHPQASMTEGMSGLQRMIYESSDFAVNAGGVFQKVDPAEVDGDDWSEMDREELLQRLQNNPAAIEWLQKHSDVYCEVSQEDALAHADVRNEQGETEDEDGTKELVEATWGYTSPRDKYRRTDAPTSRNYAKEAAERRVQQLNEWKEVANSLQSIGACEGFLEELRADYHHDRDIRNEWNENSRLRWREVFSAHLDSRQGRIDGLMVKKGQEVVSRDLAQFFKDMALWNCFDKQPMTRYLIAGENTKFFKAEKPDQEWLDRYNFTCIEYGKTRGSWWDRYRSRAFQDLVLTMSQWNQLYGIIFGRMQNLIDRLSRSNEEEDRKAAVRYAEKYGKRFGLAWIETVKSNAKLGEKTTMQNEESISQKVDLEKVFRIASLHAKSGNKRTQFQYGVVVQSQNPNTKTFWARLVREGHLPKDAIKWCWVETVPGEPDFREWIGLQVEDVIIDLRQENRRKLQIALEADLRKRFGLFGDGKPKSREQVARPVRPTNSESPF